MNTNKKALAWRAQLSIVSVSFGYSGWTKRQVEIFEAMEADAPGSIREIIIVDNNRDGWIADQLANCSSLVSVIQCRKNQTQFDYYGHDHAEAIRFGLSYSTGSRKLLLDCDSHPIEPKFLRYVDNMLNEYDAVVAHDMRDMELSHPCFMLFGDNCPSDGLHFDSGPSHGQDVGRLILSELRSTGKRIHVATKKKAFGGVWGEIWDDQIYHHGSGTFRFSDVHRSQVHKYSTYFERQVLDKRRYALSFPSRIQLAFQSRLSRLWNHTWKR